MEVAKNEEQGHAQESEKTEAEIKLAEHAAKQKECQDKYNAINEDLKALAEKHSVTFLGAVKFQGLNGQGMLMAGATDYITEIGLASFIKREMGV